MLVSRFIPAATEDMDEEELLRIAQWIAAIRGQFGRVNTLLIGSFDPAEATESVREETEPTEALAEKIFEAGYDALIPDCTDFSAETIELCAALEEMDIMVPAANVYYDGTDEAHEEGENVFTPYAMRDVNVSGRAHTIGILTLYCRGKDQTDIPGLLFVHPDNPDGTLAWEAAMYLQEMQDEGCEFIIVCCWGEPEVKEKGPDGKETDALSPAEQLIWKNTGIDLLILPTAPEEYINPPAAMTDKTSRRVPVLREDENPAGCVLTLTEDSNGELVCSGIQQIVN